MSLPTTGVGGLPHTDPGAAARFVLATADIPYPPQLPNRHPLEGMLAQWGDGLCGCGFVSGDLGLAYGAAPGSREEAFAGAAALLDGLPAGAPALKMQATGPVTLAAGLRAAGHPGRGLWACVVKGLTERVREHLAAAAIRAPHAEVTLVLDEPALSAVGSGPVSGEEEEALSALAAVLEAIPVTSGIHCCGDAEWEAVARLHPDVLSIDVASLGPRFVDGAAAIAAAVSDGCRMIWGAVPVEPPPLPSTDLLVGRIRRAEGMLVLAGADVRQLDRAWVSPACGMSGLGVAQAAAVAARVAEVAEALGV